MSLLLSLVKQAGTALQMTTTILPTRYWSVAMLLLTVAPGIALAQQREPVPVGGYLFPPFVNSVDEEQPGVTFQVIEALNREQSKYEFYFVPTGANRRYHAFQHREYDVILFESPAWGWEAKQINFKATRPWYRGGEVYVALREEGRDQSWFDNIARHRICGVFGYHYGFADFVSEPTTLEDRFDIFLASAPSICLRMVMGERLDVSVVTQSWLRQQMARNPALTMRLLASEKLDQAYSHRAILHPDSPVSVTELGSWLDLIATRGDIDRILAQ